MNISQKKLDEGVRCCGPEGCGEARDRDELGTPMRYCIGQHCAAWEFGPEPRRGYDLHHGKPQAEEPKRPKHVPASWVWVGADDESCGWYEPFESVDARRFGWCGLLARRAES